MKADLAKNYKKQVEDELTNRGQVVLDLLDQYLIKNAQDNESKVSLKMEILKQRALPKEQTLGI